MRVERCFSQHKHFPDLRDANSQFRGFLTNVSELWVELRYRDCGHLLTVAARGFGGLSQVVAVGSGSPQLCVAAVEVCPE